MPHVINLLRRGNNCGGAGWIQHSPCRLPPRKGSGAPVRTCFFLLLGRFRAVQPPQTSCPLLFFHPDIPEVTCPREGAQASLAGAGAVVGRAGVEPLGWQLEAQPGLPARPVRPAHMGISRWKGPGHRSSHLLREPRSAAGRDSCRRWEEERDLLGMPPRSPPAPGPATQERARGAGPLVTQPSHTALPPPLTTRYCLATTHVKCRSGEQIFPLSQLQCRG